MKTRNDLDTFVIISFFDFMFIAIKTKCRITMKPNKTFWQSPHRIVVLILRHMTYLITHYDNKMRYFGTSDRYCIWFCIYKYQFCNVHPLMVLSHHVDIFIWRWKRKICNYFQMICSQFLTNSFKSLVTLWFVIYNESLNICNCVESETKLKYISFLLIYFSPIINKLLYLSYLFMVKWVSFNLHSL